MHVHGFVYIVRLRFVFKLLLTLFTEEPRILRSWQRIGVIILSRPDATSATRLAASRNHKHPSQAWRPRRQKGGDTCYISSYHIISYYVIVVYNIVYHSVCCYTV